MEFSIIGDEDSWVFTILGKIGADFCLFHGGNGNWGCDGAGDGFSRDGCDYAESDISFD